MKAFLLRIIAILSVGLSLGTAASAQKRQLPPLPAGTPAPDFAAGAYSGGTLHLSDFRGKIVVLDFWATWCGPCNAAMPHLQEVLDQYKSDIVVLALCVWDTPADDNDWIPAHPYTFTYALDSSGGYKHGASPLTSAYHVSAIPTTYVIDQNGNIAAGHVVMQDGEIVAAIRELGARTEAEHAAPKTLDTLTPLMAPHEMALTGTVSGKSADGTSIVVKTTAVMVSKGQVETLDEPREKTVIISKNTKLYVGSSDSVQDTLDVGAHVNLLGLDQGVGKSLTARLIQVYK